MSCFCCVAADRWSAWDDLVELELVIGSITAERLEGVSVELAGVDLAEIGLLARVEDVEGVVYDDGVGSVGDDDAVAATGDEVEERAVVEGALGFRIEGKTEAGEGGGIGGVAEEAVVELDKAGGSGCGELVAKRLVVGEQAELVGGAFEVALAEEEVEGQQDEEGVGDKEDRFDGGRT